MTYTYYELDNSCIALVDLAMNQVHTYNYFEEQMILQIEDTESPLKMLRAGFGLFVEATEELML